MERIDAKIFFLIFFSAFAFFLLSPVETKGANEGLAALSQSYQLAQYDKKTNRLQFIVYGDAAHVIGAMTELTEPILAIVKDMDYDINSFKPLNGLKPYPLDADQKTIDEYWKDKTQLRAIISGPSGIFDITTHTLRGDGKAYFRSPEIDIDGVGFDAYQKRKFIHIRNQVKVVIRPALRRSVTPDQQKSAVRAVSGGSGGMPEQNQTQGNKK